MLRQRLQVTHYEAPQDLTNVEQRTVVLIARALLTSNCNAKSVASSDGFF